ncbi:hypothetical protein L1049_010257 [Liquidambar formosana]|uniref:Transcription factor TCP2-like n=1 Tax=Liquidambar formosana TaxID=63359 RepID=A0AAP0N8U3_LIQFO
MEVEEIQTQVCKFSRVGNGRIDSIKVGQKGGGEQYPDDEEDGEIRRGNGGGGGGMIDGGGGARLRGWHQSSRIYRVSRASGGKDRHSKVLTSKGLRDRRVRLSVTTAIQFYDLQDRLGYDQPSKAVEWLIKAASDAISELPSLNGSFPDTPKQLSDEKRASGGTEQGLDSADVDLDGDPNYQQHQQHLSLSKSACSSTSETSKGSGLSLSRSDIRVNRVKARERARERAAKEKEKENESRIANQQQHNVNHISQSSSFTELLTCGIGSVSNNTSSTTASAHQNPNGDEPNLFHKSPRQWPSSTPMDYFATGLLGGTGASSSRTTHQSSGFSGQIHLGNSLPQSMTVPQFNLSGDNQPELPQHFSFAPDHLIPVATTQPGGDYNLNFTISSGLAGFNRGTLQSNSPSLLPHFQRFSNIDGSNAPFFIGTAASANAPMENHHHHPHQFSAGFDARLHLCYGDGSRHSDQKGKGKN